MRIKIRKHPTEEIFLGVLSPGKSYVFLQSFEKSLLEILMCSLVRFASPGKFIFVLVPFLVLLENLKYHLERRTNF